MWRKRFKSRAPKKRRKRIIFFIIVLLVFLMLQSFLYIDRNLKQPLMNIASFRIKQIATQSINKAITDRIALNVDMEKLIDWQKDHNGKTTGFMLNYNEHMSIQSKTVEIVEGTLEQLQQSPEYVPLGQAMNSALLSTFGPDIPLRMVPAGAVKVELKTRQTEAGINNVLVEIYIDIVTEVAVIIPFASHAETVQVEVPISYVLIAGDVPLYYFDNKGKPIDQSQGSGVIPPTISLPDLSSGGGGSALRGTNR